MSELGNRLKEAREAKGYSLEDLQEITKIQKRYLQGIEEGNYSMMPGKFYVRAFIKQYAEAVGLEPEEIFHEYQHEIPQTTSTEEIPLSRVKTKKSITGGNSKVFDFIPKVLIAILIIGALALLYYFFLLNAGKETENQVEEDGQSVNVEESDHLKDNTAENDKTEQSDQTDQEQDTEATPDSEKEQEDQPVNPTQELVVVTSKGRESTYELKNADKFELKVVTTGETWINVLNGKGTSFFQGMLKTGATDSQTLDFSKETEAVIVIGRSTETEVFVNGQKLEYSVPPTEQVRQDITIRYVPMNE